MNVIKERIAVSSGQRLRSALTAAGIAPSGFGHRVASQAHRDRRAAERRGERKHKRTWE